MEQEIKTCNSPAAKAAELIKIQIEIYILYYMKKYICNSFI